MNKIINGVGVFDKLAFEVPDGNNVVFNDVKSARGNFKIIGNNNSVTFSQESLFNCNLRIQGNRNKIFIGNNCTIRGQILVKGDDQEVYIGEGTTFQNVYILCQEKCNVKIGKWCMFSREIEVRTTDAHSLIDKATGVRLNNPASIEIGDHVWVSLGCVISKGVVLPNDTIVGAKSFVNGKFIEESTVIAGLPAKVVKRGVTWNRGRKPAFKESELYFWND